MALQSSLAKARELLAAAGWLASIDNLNSASLHIVKTNDTRWTGRPTIAAWLAAAWVKEKKNLHNCFTRSPRICIDLKNDPWRPPKPGIPGKTGVIPCLRKMLAYTYLVPQH
jgi:hypothetical protein